MSAVRSGGGTTKLVLGDTTGAQIPSGGTADSLVVVQGFLANGAFTSSSPTVTMSVSNPGLDTGYYYVWNWSKVTSNRNPIPQCLGVTSSGSVTPSTTAVWSGTTLTLTQNCAPNAVSNSSSELIILTPVSGCIRHVTTTTSVVENCILTGIIGAIFEGTAMNTGSDNGTTAFNATVRNCSLFTSLGSSACIGNVGVSVPQSGLIENCEANGLWTGVRIWGVNPKVTGGRQETCCYGIVLGGIISTANVPVTCSGFVISNTEMEGTWGIGILADTSVATDGLITGIFNTVHANASYGMCLLKGATNLVVANSVFNGTGVSGNWSGWWNPSFAGGGTPSGIYIPNTNNPGYTTFISTTSACGIGSNNVTQGLIGPAWRVPTNPTAAYFINCNNPPIIFTFSTLPVPFSVTGRISADGTGTGAAGKVIQFTAGSFPVQVPVGSAVTGAGVMAGTFLTGAVQSASGGAIGSTSTNLVNNLQTVPPSTTLTLYPMVDGDEYLISDSPTPYLTAGVSNVGKAVTVGAGTNHVRVRWDASQLAWILV